MELLRYLLRSSRGMVLVVAASSLLCGFCNTALLVLINQALQIFRPTVWILTALLAAGLTKVLVDFFSDRLLIVFSVKTTEGLRRVLAAGILSIPLRKTEEIGPARMMASLTEDVESVSDALLVVPYIAANGAMLMGGAIYLGCLSWQVFISMLGVVLLGMGTYKWLIRESLRYFEQVREQDDRLFQAFRALTEGMKELKLHRRRRRAFLREVLENITTIHGKRTISAETRFSLAQATSQFFFYFLMVWVLFWLGGKENATRPEVLTGYIVTILFLMGPLRALLSVFPRLGRAGVALRKLDELGLCLAQSKEDSTFDQGKITVEGDEKTGRIAAETKGKPGKIDLDSIQLCEVTHSYHRENDDNHFLLGPLNLTFCRGEIVFLIGGNGSGKTTFAKVVTGLYVPEAGEVRWNGMAVTDRNREEYRQMFSTVFSDFYLFEDFLGLEIPDIDEQVRQYLTKLQLNHKVKINGGCLSTIELSQGQRKRLALLTAFLEDRPFYVFDEWAADQDPQFKNFFYHDILSQLRKQGKTALVISHDDRYFHLGDRAFRMEEGKISSV